MAERLPYKPIPYKHPSLVWHPLDRAWSETELGIGAISDSTGEHGDIIVVNGITEAPDVRIHSENFCSDIMDADSNTPHDRLYIPANTFMNEFQRRGAGVLVYLRQEFGGTSLLERARYMHKVQQDPNTPLTPDRRTFENTARTLRYQLGMSTIRLITNNPDKIGAMEAAGLDVTVVPPKAYLNERS